MQQFVQQSQFLLPVGGNRLPQPSSRGAFVVNLGSSGTPVALSSPEHPELRKFTFFVSRRREDKRERFRLHMGYFDTQQDAEALLEIVREVYPGAWAGIAPGRKAAASVPLPPVALAVEVPPAEPTRSPAVSPPVMDLQLELEPAPPAPQDEHFAAEQSLSSVRAAIASLEDSKSPVDRGSPDDSQQAATLSHTQTLNLLEAPLPAAVRAVPPLPAAESAAAYAVQLRWSQQPIGMAELPPLAIFDAYTLYRAKGRQAGVPWHALRLGFFQDEVSANQVASYILPEFAEASVVPVRSAERDSALAASASRATAPLPPGQPPRPLPPAVGGRDKVAAPVRNANGQISSGLTGQFKLIEDHEPPSAESNKFEMMLTTDDAPKPAAPAPAATAANRASKDRDKDKIKEKLKVRRPPANLEETLDVLGAGNLKLDAAKGEMLDASGVRRMRHAADRKPPARSALSRLFDRLAESIGGGR